MSQVLITEYMYTGGGPEFIEITNIGAHARDLAGWSIDDNHRQPLAFPIGGLGVLGPGESAVITEGAAAAFRISWQLGASIKIIGELGVMAGNNLGRSDEINLYDEQGVLVDRLTYGDEVIAGSIRARNASGWCTTAALGADSILGWRLSVPGDVQGTWTSGQGDRGSPGVHTPGDVAVTPPPVVSHPAGFYNESFQLVIEPPPGGGAVYYTLNGAEPSTSSELYTGPLTVAQRGGQPDVYSLIPTCTPELWRPPLTTGFKATVVRAMAVRPGAEPSRAVTRTYFVGSGVASRFTMPVVSVVSDPSHLFGYDAGIYVPGRVYDEQFIPGSHWSTRPANYTQTGAEWERPGHIEFFEPGGVLAFTQSIGLRIHGGYTRQWPQKSLRVYADSGPGHATVFNHPIFGDAAPLVHRRIILRNQGQDFFHAFCRDDLLARVLPGRDMDSMASRFAVVFVDGEYWGVHGVRERFDAYYLANHHGVDPGAVDILEGHGLLPESIVEGDNSHYVEMFAYMRSHDLAVQGHMAEMEQRMDVDQFLNYTAAEVWCGNTDWPAGNLRYWRPRTPEGRWRWNLYDLDQSMGWSAASAASVDSLGRILNSTDWSTELFRAIMRNQDARDRFVNRLADLMNSHLRPERTLAELHAIRAELEPEMTGQINRWRAPVLFATWVARLESLAQFLQTRNGLLRPSVASNFGLPGTWTLTIEHPHGADAAVRVNSIDLEGSVFPWSGVYFSTVPVRIAAEAGPGFCASLVVDGGETYAGSAVLNPASDTAVLVQLTRSGDFNLDGGIDGSDVDTFFSAWEEGSPEADFNLDGGIDGSDVSAFFSAWEAGGCG